MVNWDYFKHYFSVDLLIEGGNASDEQFHSNTTKRTSPCIIEEQTSSINKVNR